MHRTYILSLLLFASFSATANTTNDSNFIEKPIVLHTSTGDIYGTLTTPKKYDKIPVALLIAGSGPTDRDGNNPYAMNAGLKKLAYALVDNNIASVRFDKRAIGESKGAAKSEIDLRFDDYVNDAKDWVNLLKADQRFSKLIIIGHSEGSLIGMIAAAKADKFVSIAGAGRSADIIIKEQLGKQPQSIQDLAFPIIDSLKSGVLFADPDPMLASLFRPSVQPYIISWFAKDPQAEIKKLSIPILVIQGTNDIQVSEEDAKLLVASNPKAKLVLIKNMNHIFRIIEGDAEANIATYNKSSLPISDEMVKSIISFINQ